MIKFCLLWLNLFADLLCLLVVGFRSKSSLAAENLFVRKQLAFYKERRIRPRRTSHPARFDPPMAQPLVQLAQRTDCGDAQNLHWLAPQGLPVFLAPEMPI